MIPFLCNNRSICISLLEVIVKAKVLDNVEWYDLFQVVNSDDNLLQTKRIHIGFAAESEIKRLLQTKNLIQKLVGLKLIEFNSGDEALADYSKFLMNEVIQSREKFIDFKRDECRLDDFFFQKLGMRIVIPRSQWFWK